jgi:TFIIF-interacting CTD phosphatase-like protein
MINLFLDLDQTLICSELLSDFKSPRCVKEFDCHTLDNDYIIFARPHLQVFLDYIFDNFNVSVWTAASKDYAHFIVNKFIIRKDKPRRKLDLFLVKYHTVLSQKITGAPKKLDVLWSSFGLGEMYNKNNTIIIDDYDKVYTPQPERCIYIPEFYVLDADSEKDNALLVTKLHLKKITI